MAKANIEGAPDVGSEWDLDGEVVRVVGFQPKGRGGYVVWDAYTYENPGQKTKLSEWKAKAKAA